MKKLLLFFVFFILISMVCCVGGESLDTIPDAVKESSDWLGTTVQEYDGPQIVRLAWGSIPEQFTSDERFQELKEAGITHNFNWYYSSANEAEKALDAAGKAGIKVILNCPEIASDPEGTVTRFMNHQALDGYYLGDEPASDSFLVYGARAERIRALDKVHFCYVNLPRITHSDPYFGKGTENYKEYVNDFIVKVQPEFLSYDNYTIYFLKDNNELIIDPQMYENLEVIRDAAMKANKEFWAFCLSSSHSVGSGARLYPEPVLGHMRLYVYSDLAYGAQGIEYFNYWLAASINSTIDYRGEHYYYAPISFEGVKGPIYDRLKTINTEIRNLSFVFADAKVKWVRHTGNTIPKGTTKLSSELVSTPFKKLQASGGLIVSLLEKADNRYLVLVNRDVTKSIDLTIETDPAVKRVLKSGAIIDAESKLKITEGDAAIYAWKIN